MTTTTPATSTPSTPATNNGSNPALDQLNRYQGESATILFIRVALLVGMILFSANVRPVMVVQA